MTSITRFKCSGTALKRFACIAMLLDHIGAACLEGALDIPYVTILNISLIPQFSADPTTLRLLYLDCVLRAIGRLAMPIFSFFLVEGFLHTKNATRYLLRLFCFGLISEPLFDFAFWGSWFYPNHQNIYATLALGLLGLMLLQWMENAQESSQAKRHGVTLATAAGVLGILCMADWLNTDYGSAGVLLVLTLYLVRRTKAMQSLAVALLTLDQFPASFAAIPLAFYNGERGNCAKWEQWAFYAFYPAHLLILGLISHFML